MALLPTNAVEVARFANALYGMQIGSITNTNVNNDITASGSLTATLNAYYYASFGNTATATVTATLLSNLGIASTDAGYSLAQTYIKGQLDFAVATARGAVVKQLLDHWAGLTTDATYGAAATAWNAKIDSALAYTTYNTGDAVVGYNAGQTFTLTTGVDNVTGTSGNDTVLGAVTLDGSVAAAGTILQASDVINGGAGTDTLSVTVDGTLTGGTAYTLAAASTTNVETLSVRSVAARKGTATGALTVIADGSSYGSVTNFVNDRSTTTVQFNNIGKNDVTVKGDGSVVLGATTIKVGATSVTDAFALNIQGGTAKNSGAINVADTLADWTEATINSTGAANIVGAINLTGTAAASTATHTLKTLTIDAATDLTTGNITGFDTGATVTNTITVKGAATKVEIGTLAGAIDVVDASGLTTGGLKATLNSNTKIKVTGGAGNDNITSGGLVLAKADGAFVDAGAGTADRLTLTTAIATDTAGKEAAALYKNFEQLGVANGVVQDASIFAGSTIGAVRIAAGTATNTGFANLNSTQAGNITVTAGVGAVTADYIKIGVKDATVTGNIDTVKITVDNGVATDNTTVKTLGNLDLAGVEKLEVTGVDAWSITDLTKATYVDGLVIKGAAAATVTLGAVNLKINSTVDATEATGKVVIDASAAQAGSAAKGLAIKGALAAVSEIKDSKQADVVTGGTKSDVLTYTAGADTIALGGAGDKITLGTANDGWTAMGGGTGTANNGGGLTIKFAAGDSISKALATDGFDATVTDLIEGVSGAAFTGIAGHRFVIDTNVAATAVKKDGGVVVFGTTTVTNAGDFHVYVKSATEAYVYQDSDMNGKIDTGDFAIKIVGTNLSTTDFNLSATGGDLVFQGAA